MRKDNYYLKVLLFLLLSIFSCSKKSDPVATTGCIFTFQGASYTLPTITCGVFNGVQSVTATNTTQSQEIDLLSETGNQRITFIKLVSDLNSYYSSGLATPPTITISGLTWTFSGMVENTNGDSGTISGKCTCTN